MRLTPLLAVLLLATPAHAGGPQVTDPRGDANFTEAGVVTDPASFAAYDLTSVRWWNDAKGQHVTVALVSPDRNVAARYILSAATPSCDSVRIWWDTTEHAAMLEGCLVRQRRALAAPVWSATGVTFTIPVLPSWFAKGTTVHGLGASVAPAVNLWTAEVYPPADTASGAGTYVLGS